jgi:nucleoside-triphosphatase THEP1
VTGFGRYGANLPALERVAIPALEEATEREVAIIDELRKMELASQPFRDAV